LLTGSAGLLGGDQGTEALFRLSGGATKLLARPALERKSGKSSTVARRVR
jgi:hypothetical protein